MNFSWNTILAPDETLLKEFSISLRYRKFLFAVVIILSILAFFVSWYAALILLVVGGLYWWYVNTTKHYAMTAKRMVLVTSFPGQDVISVDYNEITDIEIEQSVLDQMGKWGTMIINTSGTRVPEIRLSFIDNPQGVKQTLDEIRDKTTATPQPVRQTVVPPQPKLPAQNPQ